jgi:beta-alanine degradation protein BauB
MTMAAHLAIAAETDQVRVGIWTFDGPGSGTGQHVHEFDYVVVPVTGGSFTVTSVDGSTREMTQTVGEPYVGTRGTAHDVASADGNAAVFVEVELKR